jgi:hypothetical protein
LDKDELDDLERYLLQATILDVAHFALHGAHRSHRLILEGGVAVLAKPEDTIALGPIVPRREVAAWKLARELGWPDLLGATVLRIIPSVDTGDDVEASLQVLWPDCVPDADVASFPDEDVWRAAVLDALIGHEDRNGHNWLAVPAATPRLKLVDHGYAFPDALGEPSSTFYAAKKGQDLPNEVVEALTRLVTDGTLEVLRDDLLPDAAVDAVLSRAQVLVDHGSMEIIST